MNSQEDAEKALGNLAQAIDTTYATIVDHSDDERVVKALTRVAKNASTAATQAHTAMGMQLYALVEVACNEWCTILAKHIRACQIHYGI